MCKEPKVIECSVSIHCKVPACIDHIPLTVVVGKDRIANSVVRIKQ